MNECDCSSQAGAAEFKSFEQALDLLLAHARSVTEVEQVSLPDALGRVLADPQISRTSMPPWDNSAMDGYALRAADAGSPLPVSQRIPAGGGMAPLAPGTAAKVFTGAPVPPGAHRRHGREHFHRPYPGQPAARRRSGP